MCFLTPTIGDKSDFEVVKAEADYRIPDLWNLEGAHKKGIDGEGITIAVLDSGINRHHKAFVRTTLSGKNFIDGKGEDYWYSNREEHGTMVTGIIATYAPKAEIYVCCVSEEEKYKKEAIIKALEHIRDEKECQVVVMSFGHYHKEEYKDREKLINDLARKGVICVAAVGNRGLHSEKLAYPSRLENVIAVGGLTEFGCEPAQFNTPGEVDMYAPGEGVCAPAGTKNSKYQECRGTSFAAPAIGGIVALLIQMARKSGVEINNVKSIKNIFLHMKTKIATTLPAKVEEKIVYNPRKFFCESYETPDKFKALIETIMIQSIIAGILYILVTCRLIMQLLP
jgi:subtilisin family serine protease